MNTPEESAYWLAAANRKDAEGNPAAAITFRNLAWLIEHRNTWLEWCAANPTGCLGDQKRESK
jgi:hypothetical protein